MKKTVTNRKLTHNILVGKAITSFPLIYGGVSMSNCSYDNNLYEHLCECIGETVTLFTTSGGQSGAGFTGVIISVNECFVRLITKIGPAPSCALGNACCGFPKSCNCSCSLGSVTEIPISRIAAFVRNAV